MQYIPRDEGGRTEEPRWLRALRLLPMGLVLLGAVAGAVLVALHGSPDLGAWLSALRARPLLCAAALLGIFLLKGCSAVVPYAVICAAAGLLLPLPAALALVLVGTVLCVSVSYGIGLWAGYSVEYLIRRYPKLARFYHGERQQLFSLSLVLRTLGVQSEVLGLLFGTLRMRYLPFLLSSLLGIMTTMLSHTLLGTAGRVPLWVIAAFYLLDAAVLVTVTLLWYRGHRRARRAGRTGEGTSALGTDASDGNGIDTP